MTRPRARAFKVKYRHKRFVSHFVRTLSGKAAAIAAGAPEKSAGSIASNWLRNPQIREDIRARLDLLTHAEQVTEERVISEIAAIAFTREIDDTGGGAGIRTMDKLRALRMLGEYLKIFRNELNINLTKTPEQMTDAELISIAKKAKDVEPLRIESG